MPIGMAMYNSFIDKRSHTCLYCNFPYLQLNTLTKCDKNLYGLKKSRLFFLPCRKYGPLTIMCHSALASLSL